METVAPLIVLLHFPNLGPASWRPGAVAAAIISLAAEARAAGASLRSLR